MKAALLVLSGLFTCLGGTFLVMAWAVLREALQ